MGRRERETPREAIYAEYRSPHELLQAIQRFRERGYRHLSTYTPYADKELHQALGQRPSRLPIAICAAGLSGAAFAYFLQWLLVAYLYPLNVGGRPPHMPLAFAVITFEMGVLAAGLTAFFGVLYLARLLRLYDPVFEVEGIGSASVDGHWLRVDATDARFHPEHTRALLDETGAARVVHRGPPS